MTTIKSLLDRWWVILLGCTLFTLLMLWNFIFPLNAILTDRDYVLQLWNLWLVNESIIAGQNPYITDLQYYPVGAHLGRHVLSPGFFPITLLVWLLSNGDILYPLYTYKVIILLSYTLILFFSYLTFRALDINRWGAIIAATGYTFGNFYMNHMNRLHIISAFFIPISAYCVIRLFHKPTLKRAVICAFFLAVGLYFTELILFVYMSLLFIIALMIILPRERQALYGKIADLGLQPIIISSFTFFVVASLFIFNWVTSDSLPATSEENYRYSSNLA
ncbi:MAG: hypothetical protein AAF485_18010, partial [Chloroflexota bacterium]